MGTCVTAASGDRVYRFTTTAVKNVALHVRPSEPTYLPVVYLRSVCGTKGSEVACAHGTGTSVPVGFTLTRLAAGTYHVWVDSYGTGPAEGAYELTLDVSDPAPLPPNDTCANPEALVFDSFDVATATGDTTDATHNYSGSCALTEYPLNGNDLVYMFTLDEPARVRIEATRNQVDFDHANILRRTCASAAAIEELGCNHVLSDTVNLAHLDTALPAGTYYIIVDGAGRTPGSFTLSVRKLPVPEADACFNAAPLAFDEQGQATVLASTADASAGGEGSCTTAVVLDGRDLVCRFELAEERDVTVTLSPHFGSNLWPRLHVRRVCEDRASEVGCVDAHANKPISLDLPMLAPGTYYVFADTGSFEGAFALTVSARTPATPANDACAGAEELDFDRATGIATVFGDTRFAHDDDSGSCVEARGRDVVYRFTTLRPHRVEGRLMRDRLTPGFEPVLYLRSACASATLDAERSCSRALEGTATLVASALPEGTWYLWVDGAAKTQGAFRLEVALGDPLAGAPANEACFAPEPLVFNGATATALGSTALAQDEATGTCAEPGAADVVYHFTTLEPRRVEATVTPAAGSDLRPAVYLRSACAGLLAREELGCAAAATAAAHAMAFDGTSLIVASNRTGGVELVSFSTLAPGAGTPLGTNTSVESVTGIAADASYLYVAGKGLPGGVEGVYRIDRADLTAAARLIARIDTDQALFHDMALDSLSGPTILYVRAVGGAIHAVMYPASEVPIHLGAVLAKGVAADLGMAYDPVARAIYFVETETPGGAVWKVE